jgi:hypothetical protein
MIYKKDDKIVLLIQIIFSNAFVMISEENDKDS